MSATGVDVAKQMIAQQMDDLKRRQSALSIVEQLVGTLDTLGVSADVKLSQGKLSISFDLWGVSSVKRKEPAPEPEPAPAPAPAPAPEPAPEPAPAPAPAPEPAPEPAPAPAPAPEPAPEPAPAPEPETHFGNAAWSDAEIAKMADAIACGQSLATVRKAFQHRTPKAVEVRYYRMRSQARAKAQATARAKPPAPAVPAQACPSDALPTTSNPIHTRSAENVTATAELSVRQTHIDAWLENLGYKGGSWDAETDFELVELLTTGSKAGDVATILEVPKLDVLGRWRNLIGWQKEAHLSLEDQTNLVTVLRHRAGR